VEHNDGPVLSSAPTVHTAAVAEPTASPKTPANDTPPPVADIAAAILDSLAPVIVVEPAPIVAATPPATEIVAAPAGLPVTLTSRLGTGTVALTAILMVLVIGVWHFGHRLAIQLAPRRIPHE
jgi:hypothetical protein